MSSGVTFFHDNTRPHNVQTQVLIKSFVWEQLDHPPYLPDLATSDYHLFQFLKDFLGGHLIERYDNIQTKIEIMN